MIDESLYRICNFLNQFVWVEGGLLRPDPNHIKAAIKLLIEKQVMSKDEMRKEALRDYLVIIPDEFFPGG